MLWHAAIVRLIARLNPVRKPRSNPRVIKRKVIKWAAKRTHHRDWPQPNSVPRYTIQNLN